VLRVMEIIPVIDLMNGVAVHAKQGRRESYRPLQSSLCASAEPCDVIAGLLRLHPFSTFYIADLDALTGKGNQRALVRALAEGHREQTFWVDAGWPAEDGPWTNVIGSESLTSVAWRNLGGHRRDWILSLDFLDGRLKGPGDILEQPDAWPERVIVMSLNQVGSFAGPDIQMLEKIRRLAPHRHWIAAGGVRDDHDVTNLEVLGIDTVLVASALHAGRLKTGSGRTVKGKSAD